MQHQVDADFTQALLNCCLKVHFDTIIDDSELMQKVRELKETTEKRFSSFEDMLAENICMISHFTGVQINSN